MNELQISFDTEVSIGVNKEKIIKVKSIEEGLIYKFIIGSDGIWKTIQDFSEKDSCVWIPKETGKYTIMVQGKDKNSRRPFDCMTKEEINVLDDKGLKLIEDIKINNADLVIGEKLIVDIISYRSPVLYRFWINGKQGWEPIRDYTSEGKLVYTATKEGKHEILIECKRPESKEKFEDFKTIRFDVSLPRKIEISDFRCLTRELLINEELVFKVDTTLDDKRILLYKFVKINKDGKCSCIQDFSSRKIVSYQENQKGEYKLLCLVRDILSTNDYDDRAIIHYNVKPYRKVKINNLRTDVNSPQLKGSTINIRADVEGGRELLYRYVVEGPSNKDTGYNRSKEYVWETKNEGEYKITLFIKDISSKAEFEDKKTIVYSINEKSDKPIRIIEIVAKKNEYTLVGTPVNISVSTEGGTDLRYSFIVYKNNVETERVDYGIANWVDFIPEDTGTYEIEVRVKDKYSVREYDSNDFLKLKARNYIPAKIDYILVSNKERHIVGDEIGINVIAENTNNIFVKYVTKINNRLIEETQFIKDKKLIFKPKCAGKYTFEIYAKSIESSEQFDCKKEVKFYVYENMLVSNTKIIYNKDSVAINKEVTFSVTSQGGKDVCYQFYIMENDNWVKMQGYSRKNYYTFIPYLKGRYKIMVMAKSYYKDVNYEDYDEAVFEVT